MIISPKKIMGILEQNTLTLIGTIMVAFIIFIGVTAPLICPYDPNLMNIPARLQAPSLAHFFGTDEMGRDVFTRVIYGFSDRKRCEAHARTRSSYYCSYSYFIHFLVLLSSILWDFTVSVHGRA